MGAAAGTVFDVIAVAEAIKNGDGNKAGETVLSMALGIGMGAAAIGIAATGGAPAAIAVALGGVGAIGAGFLAEELNPYFTRPLFDFIGSFIPDGFWRGLEGAVFGDGAARLDPTGAVYVAMLMTRIDNNVSQADLGALFDKAGSARQGRETVAVLNAFAKVWVPSASALANDATDEQIIAMAGRIAAVTDQAPGAFRISATPATAVEAKTDFSAFLALSSLSPVWVQTNDPAALALLQSANARLATDWQADRNARLYGDTDYAFTFSEQWYEDRAALVGLLSKRNEGEYQQEVLGGGTPVSYEDRTSGTTVELGLGGPNVDKRQVVFGSDASEADLNGGIHNDRLYGGAANDTLNGQGGNDYLEGGDGLDLYQFTGAWGKDTIQDTDGLGSIQIDGQTLGAAKASGKLNTWVAELGAGSGVYVGMSVYDDARSSTGKRLVIVKGSDTANTITINKFDLTKAQQPAGYLGIQLDPARRLAVKEGAGANVWSDPRFDPATLSAGSSSIVEGGAKTYTVHLNRAALAGETLTLSLSAQADKFQVRAGDKLVAANGAVITLVAGQTEARFALVQVGEISANSSAQLSVSYQPTAEPGAPAGSSSSSAVQSNAWAVGQTQRGAQRAKVIGTEIDLSTPPSNARFGTYKWEATSWGADGTLMGGVAAANFSDVLRGTPGNDKLSGQGRRQRKRWMQAHGVGHRIGAVSRSAQWLA